MHAWAWLTSVVTGDKVLDHRVHAWACPTAVVAGDKVPVCADSRGKAGLVVS